MEGVMNLSPEDDALVQGLLDGALDPAERKSAERLVDSSDAARRRSSDLTELARLLDTLGPAEPPMHFSADVMREVGQSHSHAEVTRALGASSRRLTFGERLSQLTDGGFGMGKKLMWGLVATAAVALIVMKFAGYPPVDGAQGTVGAAKRYQAEQIAGSDVKVDDSAQAFLQSDTFDQLMKDPDTRQALASPSFRGALASPEFRLALASPEFARALASPDFARALASPQFVGALSAPQFANALANPDFAKALAAPGFAKALASPDFAKALGAPGFARALSSPSFAKALASPGFSKALASPQMVQALGLRY
jgi:hypothetical protein